MLLTQIAWAQAEQRRTQQSNRLLGGYISRIQHVSHLLTASQGRDKGGGDAPGLHMCVYVDP